MRQPGPIPRHVVLTKLVATIRARHAGDPTRLPSADNLLALLEYVTLHVDDLPEEGDRHKERVEALYLSRLIEQSLLRFKRRLYKGGISDGMTARQIGKPEGLDSRPAIGSRIKAYQERLDAAAVYMKVSEYRKWKASGFRPVDRVEDLLEIARRLIAHVGVHDEDSGRPLLAEDQDVLDSSEGIELTLKEPTEHQAGSVRSQMRDIVDELDHAAAEQGRPPALGPATADLQAARDWLDDDGSSSAGGEVPDG